MNSQPTGALVIGGHFQALGLIRALARRRVPILLADSEPCMARFSKYVLHYYQCPPPDHTLAFKEWLMEMGKKQIFRGKVIFPTDDETVFALAKYRSDLSRYYSVSTPPWDITRYAYNKRLSYRLSESLDIPVPRTWYPDSSRALSGMNISFPVLLKPAVMRPFFKKFGKKVFRVYNIEQLRRGFEKASEVLPEKDILIQEEIPEVSRNLFSFCPVVDGGKVRAGIMAKRIRQHPMDFGQATTYAVSVYIPQLEEYGTRILKAMNYQGLCEVEFIRDPRDGIFKFLEINPRVWGWHTLALEAGVNLPYIVYQAASGHRMRSNGFDTGVKWMRILTDFPTAAGEIIRGRLGIAEYMRSWKGGPGFAVLSGRDPVPFFGELFILPYLWKKRGF